MLLHSLASREECSYALFACLFMKRRNEMSICFCYRILADRAHFEVPIMEIAEAIRARRDIRSYQDRLIEEEKLTRVLDAGRLAPSARNLLDWKFIVVRDKDKRQRLSEAPIYGIQENPRTEYNCLPYNELP